MSINIPFSRPTVGVEEINAVRNVFNSGWLTVGKVCEEFENKLKEYIGCEHAVVLDSCTSALTLGAKALTLCGYEVDTAYVPALTFVATANAMYRAGFKVEFVDVDMTGNMNFALLPYGDQLIVPVHFAGQPYDLYKLDALADYLIMDDAAHAMGSVYPTGLKVGNIRPNVGSCFSFYATKNMTTGEGGLFTTRHKELADEVRTLSLHGLGSSHSNRYERSSLAKPTVEYPGYKANMTNIEAAIGIEQLKKLDGFIKTRKFLVSVYQKELSNVEQLEVKNNDGHSWHMFIILVNNRDEKVIKLREMGVGVGIHYSPIIPKHPFYETKQTFPVAEYISEHCISLPLYPTMGEDEQAYVIESVKKVL